MGCHSVVSTLAGRCSRGRRGVSAAIEPLQGGATEFHRRGSTASQAHEPFLKRAPSRRRWAQAPVRPGASEPGTERAAIGGMNARKFNPRKLNFAPHAPIARRLSVSLTIVFLAFALGAAGCAAALEDSSADSKSNDSPANDESTTTGLSAFAGAWQTADVSQPIFRIVLDPDSGRDPRWVRGSSIRHLVASVMRCTPSHLPRTESSVLPTPMAMASTWHPMAARFEFATPATDVPTSGIWSTDSEAPFRCLSFEDSGVAKASASCDGDWRLLLALRPTEPDVFSYSDDAGNGVAVEYNYTGGTVVLRAGGDERFTFTAGQP